MPNTYSGLVLDPTNDDVSIWSWLFEHGNAATPSSSPRGFRDAATGELLSHAGLRDASKAASFSLRHVLGLKPLQTVAVVSRNSIAYPVAVMAASRLGAVVTLLPPDAGEDDLAYFFGESSTVLVFADAEALGRVTKSCSKLPKDAGGSTKIVTLDGIGSRQSPSLKWLVNWAQSSSTSSDQPLTNDSWKPADGGRSTCAFLAFTSGTTGKPKAVMISHANVINQLSQMRQLAPPNMKPATVLGILPFFHITGLVHLLHLPPLLDQNLVIMSKFDMTTMMQTIVKYRCTELWLVPPLLIRLLSDKAARGYDLSFVEQFNTGAAPLAEQIIEQLRLRFPSIRLKQSWGMTETTSCVTVTPAGLMTWDNATKVGKIVPGTDLRIVDPETGKDVARGQPGEIWVNGPQVTMGYLRRPAETAETYVQGGFLRTGDIGSIDDQGFITISDRIKAMIKVRGNAVAPAELEDLILGHPSVADAAIIGIPHSYSGEVPLAFVVLRDGVSSKKEQVKDELVALVAKKKAKHKRLVGGVEFVDEIPKSAAGKILRRVLKDRWRSASENGQPKENDITGKVKLSKL